MSSQDVITFIRQRIINGLDLQTICEQLMDNCLATESGCYGIGCDNMTVVILGFLHSMSVKEWQESIANRSSSVDNIPYIPSTSAISDC
jgi:protein phosphatase 2C family protein 2/3